jgi:hypothetical protein
LTFPTFIKQSAAKRGKVCNVIHRIGVKWYTGRLVDEYIVVTVMVVGSRATANAAVIVKLSRKSNSIASTARRVHQVCVAGILLVQAFKTTIKRFATIWHTVAATTTALASNTGL